MRVIHITAGYESGGAALAVRSLHEALLAAGVESRVVCGAVSGGHAGVERFQSRAGALERAARAVRHQLARRAWLRGLRGLTSPYDTLNFFGEPLSEEVAARLPEADVYHIHWTAGFVSGFRMLPVLTRRARVVWTFHDMEPMTGGCSYSKGCRRFEEGCGLCPFLGAQRERDLSRRNWEAKRACLARADLGRVRVHVASRWMEEQVRASSLWRGVAVSRVPLGVDTRVFHARNRPDARRALALPEDRATVLFAATRLDNPIKGFATVREALGWPELRGRVHLLLVGSVVGMRLDDLPVPQTHFGLVGNPHLMNLIMRSADVFVMPSQWETFGLTAVEAIASGCRAVLADTSGLRDAAELTGGATLAPPDVPARWAAALTEMLNATEQHGEAEARSARAAQALSMERMAEGMLELYQNAS